MRNRAGLVLGLAVGVLVLLAVVAGVLSAARSGPSLPEGSPEAVVQAYVSAVVGDDADVAATHLDPEGRCSESDVRGYGRTTARVVLRDVDIIGETATVDVEFVHGGSGPFGGDEWREEQTYELRRHDGTWVITGEPWPMYYCEGNGR
ncbi:hypothetical protein FB476_1423 [Ornithinimicrobium humiphilum]|uniref:Lumazine-binding protein n=1 Tax=Ornithinimicrobium humiphilum TaxID=125288 RepID=A0A543KNB5_9MICO|nr:hypothetical protein [Ornithinimicrobium humiphilum]TQM96554.1 hypothetical protein FB476_1423 [Ornithinimicrobium humiphilum]